MDLPTLRLSGRDALARLRGSTRPELIAQVARLDPRPGVRRGAILRLLEIDPRHPELLRFLEHEETWVGRAALIRSLPGFDVALRAPASARAATDPSWRVREALLDGLLGLPPQEALQHVAVWSTGRRPLGVRGAVEQLLTGRSRFDEELPEPPDPVAEAPFWDPDPQRCAALLEASGDDGLQAALPFLPHLLEHDLAALRSLALEGLRRHGATADLAAAFARLEEPRAPHLCGSLRRLERLAGRVRVDEALALLPPLLAQRAEQVLTPLQVRAPRTRRPPRRPLRRVGDAAQVPRRALGRTGLSVSALGLSGHYGLAEEGVLRGLEAGVNLFFWEPGYSAQTRALRSLTPQRRAGLVILGGSYRAGSAHIRADAIGALRALGLERLPLFIVWWVRSQARYLELLPALEQLQQEGLIGHYGFSSHDRALSRALIEQTRPAVVLQRVNAVHPGVAREVLPVARTAGCGVIGFSALRWGRLLRPLAGRAEDRAADAESPSAPDCYRYALGSGVDAVLSAPARLDQLAENLAVLADPTLPAERRAQLAALGRRHHAEQRMRARTLRWR